MNSSVNIKKLYEMFINLDIDNITIDSPEGSLYMAFGDDKPQPKKTQHEIAEPVPTVQVTPPSEPVKSIEKTTDVTSPAVGTFERTNPKTNEYYVKLRDTIKEGQIIGHIDVLGVRQDVISHASGKIIDILMEHQQPVEYGQPIIRLEVSNES